MVLIPVQTNPFLGERTITRLYTMGFIQDNFKSCSAANLKSIPYFGKWMNLFAVSFIKLRYSEPQAIAFLRLLMNKGLQSCAQYYIAKDGKVIIVLMSQDFQNRIEIESAILELRFDRFITNNGLNTARALELLLKTSKQPA